jgi:hypothetical protein
MIEPHRSLRKSLNGPLLIGLAGPDERNGDLSPTERGFLGSDGDDLVGVACLTDLGGSVSFPASTAADYCEFLSHPQERADFVEAVFAQVNLAALSPHCLTLPSAETVRAVSQTPGADP